MLIYVPIPPPGFGIPSFADSGQDADMNDSDAPLSHGLSGTETDRSPPQDVPECKDRKHQGSHDRQRSRFRKSRHRTTTRRAFPSVYPSVQVLVTRIT